MRKRQAKKRPLLPDPKFKDKMVTRVVNNIMRDGKKSELEFLVITFDYKFHQL